MADDEHVFPYIVAHVSMLYVVYSDYIQLYEEKYVRCDVECRGAQRDTMATKLKWTKLKWCPTSSLALLK